VGIRLSGYQVNFFYYFSPLITCILISWSADNHTFDAFSHFKIFFKNFLLPFILFTDKLPSPGQLSTGPSAGLEVETTRGVRTRPSKGLQSGIPERLPLCDSLLRHFSYFNTLFRFHILKFIRSSLPAAGWSPAGRTSPFRLVPMPI